MAIMTTFVVVFALGITCVCSGDVGRGEAGDRPGEAGALHRHPPHTRGQYT